MLDTVFSSREVIVALLVIAGLAFTLYSIINSAHKAGFDKATKQYKAALEQETLNVDPIAVSDVKKALTVEDDSSFEDRIQKLLS